MLGYQKMDASEGIDINKSNPSKNVNFVTIGFLKLLLLNSQ